jgi:hypothetical protein
MTLYGGKGQGGIVFDGKGTAYVGLTNIAASISRILPDLTPQIVHTSTSDFDYWSSAAVADNGKIIYLADRLFTIYDWQTGSMVSVSFGDTYWGLYGPSPVIGKYSL